MRNLLYFLMVSTLLATGCEDGPEQVFTPVAEGDDLPRATGTTWTPEGRKPYTNSSGGDAVGRARFCDEDETEAQIREMVVAPIIPDVSVGTIPLLGPEGQPYLADDLLGRPEDGKYCDPTGVYADAFVWGPTNEVIVFFDTESRLVEAVMAYQSYLGNMTGTVTIDGEQQEVIIKPREAISIGGRELTEYASSFERNRNADAFLNEQNVTHIYGMVRETFFNDDPLPADFNCIQAKRCRIIYTAPNQENSPQDSFIVLDDSGIQLRLAPDGTVILVYVQPVRVAPFEISTSVDLGTDAFTPVLTSTSQDGCSIDLNAEQTWAQFRETCVPTESARNRISYNVHSQRDGVSAEFNGITLDFKRNVSESEVFRDGEGPADEDVLYEMTWTLTMSAPISNYIPSLLARGYRQRLSRRLRDALLPGARPDHPFQTYRIDVPDTVLAQDQPFPLDVIAIDPANGDNTNWIRSVVDETIELYESLDAADRAAIDPRVGQPIFLVEPFVETALEQLSDGRTEEDGAFVALRSTDDQTWSIGYGHFVENGVAYRLVVQFSNGYGAITAVTVSRGYSEVDEIYAGINASVRNRAEGVDDYPYYQIGLSNIAPEINPYALGGTAMTVTGFDRQLDTVTVNMKTVSLSGAIGQKTVTVPGSPIEDRNGYVRAIAGERLEFIPANYVRLLGKETLMDFYIEADGTIGSVVEYLFKGSVKLCDGPTIFPPADPDAPEDAPAPEPIDTSLYVNYGDDMPKTLEAWRAVVGDETYRDCQVLFNWSSDGHVLDSVFSLKSKTSFTTVADRAINVKVWK